MRPAAGGARPRPPARGRHGIPTGEHPQLRSSESAKLKTPQTCSGGHTPKPVVQVSFPPAGHGVDASTHSQRTSVTGVPTGWNSTSPTA